MAIEVEFPDGTIRKVPSVQRELKSNEIGGTGSSVFIDEPSYDPEWRFAGATGGKWFARPRNG